MAEFRGPKNLHVGEDLHSEYDHDTREYVLRVDAKKAASELRDYLASEGFTESSPSAASDDDASAASDEN